MLTIKNLKDRKERFLRDGIPVRIGGIAANLARVKTIARNVENEAVAFRLFEESKFFIEWTAPEASIETAEVLVQLQIQIAVWQRAWRANWSNEVRRNSMANASGEWSRKMIEYSGLLDK